MLSSAVPALPPSVIKHRDPVISQWVNISWKFYTEAADNMI